MRLGDGCLRVLCRATEAFIDRERGELPSPEAAGVPVRMERMAAALPTDQVVLLRLGASALQALAVFRFGRRFTTLDERRARRLLRGLSRSRFAPFRRLHAVLQMMCQFAWFADEATWPVTGFDGPSHGNDAARLPPPDLAPRARP